MLASLSVSFHTCMLYARSVAKLKTIDGMYSTYGDSDPMQTSRSRCADLAWQRANVAVLLLDKK